MRLGQQEIRHGFLKKTKLTKTKTLKHGTLNRARMLEHRIQHQVGIFVLSKVKPTHKYPTPFLL